MPFDGGGTLFSPLWITTVVVTGNRAAKTAPGGHPVWILMRPTEWRCSRYMLHTVVFNSGPDRWGFTGSREALFSRAEMLNVCIMIPYLCVSRLSKRGEINVSTAVATALTDTSYMTA